MVRHSRHADPMEHDSSRWWRNLSGREFARAHGAAPVDAADPHLAEAVATVQAAIEEMDAAVARMNAAIERVSVRENALVVAITPG